MITDGKKTGIDVLEWAKRGWQLGAGEILLTSVDKEGTAKGFDLDLIKTVSTAVPIPVIACGGMGQADDFVTAVCEAKADAVAMAHVLHYGLLTVEDIRRKASENGINVRSL